MWVSWVSRPWEREWEPKRLSHGATESTVESMSERQTAAAGTTSGVRTRDITAVLRDGPLPPEAGRAPA